MFSCRSHCASSPFRRRFSSSSAARSSVAPGRAITIRLPVGRPCAPSPDALASYFVGYPSAIHFQGQDQSRTGVSSLPVHLLSGPQYLRLGQQTRVRRPRLAKLLSGLWRRQLDALSRFEQMPCFCLRSTHEVRSVPPQIEDWLVVDRRRADLTSISFRCCGFMRLQRLKVGYHFTACHTARAFV